MAWANSAPPTTLELMTGIDLETLVAALHEIIPSEVRPSSRSESASEELGTLILRACSAMLRSKELTPESEILSRVVLRRTEADGFTVGCFDTTDGTSIILDRGALGSLMQNARAVSLFYNFDTSTGAIHRRGGTAGLLRSAKIERFYLSYYHDSRYAGNFVSRFVCIDQDPMAADLALQTYVWGQAFLVLHEAAHLVLPKVVPELKTQADEFMADEWSLLLCHQLANYLTTTTSGSPLAMSSNETLITAGAILALETIRASELAFFIRRPASHPSGKDRVYRLRNFALRRVGAAAQQSIRLLEPVHRLAGFISEPPPVNEPSVKLSELLDNSDDMFGRVPAEYERAAPTGSQNAVDLLDLDESFSRYVHFPTWVQEEVVGKAALGRLGQSAMTNVSSAGCKWFWSRFASRISQLEARTRSSGLTFRDAVEFNKDLLEPLGFSHRIACISLLWHALGWDPNFSPNRVWGGALVALGVSVAPEVALRS
jgi:hypothetical protein